MQMSYVRGDLGGGATEHQNLPAFDHPCKKSCKTHEPCSPASKLQRKSNEGSGGDYP